MGEKNYITDIYIHGFQSHEDTHIKLEPGFNAIVGPSNSGKSAIVRNLEFVLFNQLNDSGFITNGLSEYSSTVVFSNGRKLTRGRKGNENYYILEYPEKEDAVVLNSFGRGPIDEVLDFHGIKPIKIAGDDEFISIQSQHNPAFFLTESPAKKASLVGAIAKTDAVDAAISDIGLDISRTKSEVKLKKKKLKELTEKIKEYDDIPILEERLEKAEKASKKICELTNSIDEIEKHKKNTSSKLEKLNNIQSVLNNKNLIMTMGNKYDAMEILTNKTEMFEKVSKEIAQEAKKLDEYSKTIKRISKESLLKADKLIEKTERQDKEIENIISMIVSINNDICKLKKSERLINNKEKIAELSKKKEEFNEGIDAGKEAKELLETLKNNYARYTKGVSCIKEAKETLDNLRNKLSEEIQKSPICPTCGADMTGRESDIIGN